MPAFGYFDFFALAAGTTASLQSTLNHVAWGDSAKAKAKGATRFTHAPQLHVSVSVTVRIAAEPQRSVQDAAPRQSTLQEPVHSTSQRAPASQRTLLLAPTVTSHVEFAAQFTLELCAVETMHVAFALQSTLQDSLQVYSQSLPAPQSRLQLPAHVEPQTWPSAQAQLLALLHTQPGPGQAVRAGVDELQATAENERMAKARDRVFMDR